MSENTFVSLDLDLFLVVNGEPATFKKVANVLSYFDLTRVRTRNVVAEGRERSYVTTHCFDSECGRSLREEVKEVRVVKDDRGEGSRDGGSVENSESFFGLERDGSNVVESERFGRRQDLLATISNDPNLDVGVTSEGTSDVRERREISRGGDGTTERDDGKDIVVDQGNESLEHRPSNCRVTSVETPTTPLVKLNIALMKEETHRRRELARMSIEPRTTSKGILFSSPRPRVKLSKEVGRTPQS